MASFLSSAVSYLGRTTLQSNYTIDTSVAPVHCGNWRIQRAVRNSAVASSSAAPAAGSSSNAAASSSAANNPSADLGAGKGVVSIWEAKIEAKGGARQLMVETLKKEAATLTRLRHPCILSVVEPAEESRSSIVFATEPVVASLQQAVVASESSGRASAEVALDEVEVQKGLLQVARGLEFLHTAGMIHGNLDSHAVCINAKGDWKLCSFGFLTPLKQPDGTPTPFQHPDYDPSLPPSMSVNFDYLAPEYALEQKREPGNDMYSLGCIVYAVHSKGDPPFRNRNSLTNLRSNAERLSTIRDSPEWRRLGRDVSELLGSLLTRFPGGRLTAQTFQKAGYFNNILVSTLKFLERESFSGRSKEERVSFLKGLLGVLPQFSDRLLRRKVLPALLELMSDRSLLPFILPNVFHIARTLSSIEFTSSVLPRLQPLFALQDPPQNQLMLLDQIELFVAKTSPQVFREGVTPLLYSALEAEQASVQERALQQIPRLCEVLEYSHVKEVLFPKIATVFSKTKTLSIKVSTLIAFHHMIPILDKYTLTEKLVPLLARIKTREPSVMIATLAVHEALASKVDRETLAIHIIPQLWAMSMGPLLNADQFQKFMKATRQLGDQVAKEHSAHLQEMRRMQEHSDTYAGGSSGASGANGMVAGQSGSNGEVDFATLVGSGRDSSTGIPRDVTGAQASSGRSGNDVFDPFAFDETPAISRSVTPLAPTPSLTPSHTGAGSGLTTTTSWMRPPPRPLMSPTSSSGGTPAQSHSASTLPTLSTQATSTMKPSPLSQQPVRTSSSSSVLPPTLNPPPGWSSGSTLTPSGRSLSNLGSASMSTTLSTGSGPNYNISIPSANLNGSMGAMTLGGSGLLPLQPQTSSLGPVMSPTMATSPGASTTTSSGPPGWQSGGGSVLQPTRKNAGGFGGTADKSRAQGGLGEFDPFA